MGFFTRQAKIEMPGKNSQKQLVQGGLVIDPPPSPLTFEGSREYNMGIIYGDARNAEKKYPILPPK